MSMLSNPDADRVEDIDNNGIDKTWEHLLQESESIDQCVHQLLKIAILYKRCGECWHQGSWHDPEGPWVYRTQKCKE